MGIPKQSLINRRDKLKNVIAYYNEINKVYVDKEEEILKKEGINIEKININTLTKAILTPSFVVLKNNRYLAKLEGKQTPGIVTSWVKSYVKE